MYLSSVRAGNVNLRARLAAPCSCLCPVKPAKVSDRSCRSAPNGLSGDEVHESQRRVRLRMVHAPSKRRGPGSMRWRDLVPQRARRQAENTALPSESCCKLTARTAPAPAAMRRDSQMLKLPSRFQSGLASALPAPSAPPRARRGR